MMIKLQFIFEEEKDTSISKASNFSSLLPYFLESKRQREKYTFIWFLLSIELCKVVHLLSQHVKQLERGFCVWMIRESSCGDSDIRMELKCKLDSGGCEENAPLLWHNHRNLIFGDLCSACVLLCQVTFNAEDYKRIVILLFFFKSVPFHTDSTTRTIEREKESCYFSGESQYMVRSLILHIIQTFDPVLSQSFKDLSRASLELSYY